MNHSNLSKKPPLEPQHKARPFLKWAGGKSQLLSSLQERLPESYGHYFEPFVGGGALYFSLAPKQATISDTNFDLILTYKVIQSEVHALIEELKKHVYEESYYYRMRDADRSSEYQSWSEVARAARFIYLNKSCYNGLYRVNASNQFNVPFGNYKSPKILDEENLLACSALLKNTNIIHAGFEQAVEEAKANDFVYFDPPYVPVSKTALFTSYTQDGFSIEAQERLFRTFVALDEKGVKVMLSNSFTEYALGKFKKFNTSIVESGRAINSKKEARGKVKEIVVTNY